MLDSNSKTEVVGSTEMISNLRGMGFMNNFGYVVIVVVGVLFIWLQARRFIRRSSVDLEQLQELD